jgi:branched-chain amino acid transport system permease protein
MSLMIEALLGQILAGLINGAFYALLSLGLAIIFGLLNIVNFAHGVQYMMGAVLGWFLLTRFGVSYWVALLIVPPIVGLVGVLIERLLISKTYKLDHTFSLLMTLGIGFTIEGLTAQLVGSGSLFYSIPSQFRGGLDLGVVYIPYYRLWVIAVSAVVCTGVWLLFERTALGARLRATAENPVLVSTFAIDVPRLLMVTYGVGVALAALAGVMAAPILQVQAMMGSSMIITVFAVVVIGGLGSIRGAIVAGFGVGFIEGVTAYVFPPASTTVIFLLMAIVLLIKPSGLFGRDAVLAPVPEEDDAPDTERMSRRDAYLACGLLVVAVFLPFVVYPLFLTKILIFSLFAAAFAFLAKHAGILSFGHAAFFGTASYATAWATSGWGLPTEMAMAFGVLCSTLLGLIFGGLVIRRRGIYLAMITMALAQMVYFAAVQAPFTHGEDGLRGARPGLFLGVLDLSNIYVMYFFVLAFVAAGTIVLVRIKSSPFGRILFAVQQNEGRMISLGYEVNQYKLIAFVISAALSGLAGSLKAISLQLASLTDVHWIMSAEVLLISLLGGMTTIIGPILGAAIMGTIEFYLAPWGSWIVVVQGTLFICCVLFIRRGLADMLLASLDYLSGRRAPASPDGTEQAATRSRT